MSSPVEQIKQRLSVVDVVGSYIKLQKAGANLRALCPFHSEKNASFYVSPPRDIWHCFSCSRGGDLFEFVKQIEGVEFPEALRILADRAGVKLTRHDPRLQNEKTRLLDLLKEAAVFYQKQLVKNKTVLKYLWDRGLKNETLKNFHLGFAPEEDKGWRHLFNYLKSKGYTTNEAEKTGLAIKSDKKAGDYYDRFRQRIMFPLKDASGRVVGFSGRVVALPSEASAKEGGEEKEGAGKYINTPQTILYDKSKILYGFDRAKAEIRKKDACVLVEGQMDVLMSYQAGVENAIAVSGTALTEKHLEIIRRLTTNLIMAFDSDEAGLKASKRSIDLALQNDFEVKAISMPQGKDPADIILENPKKWSDLVDKAEHIISFYLRILEERYKDDSRRLKLEVQKNVLPYIKLIQSEIDKSHWVSEIAKRIGVKDNVVWEEIKKAKSFIDKKELYEKKPAPIKNRRVLLQERLIGIVLWKDDKSLISDAVKDVIWGVLKDLDKDSCDKIALETELYYEKTENLEQEIDNLSKELQKEIIKEKLADLAEEMRKLELAGKNTEEQLIRFQLFSKELADIN